MSDNQVVTLSQIRDLIKSEKLKPSDLFDDDAIKQIKEKGKSEGYAEGLTMARKQAEAAKQKEPEDDAEKYTDPKYNPLIKTGDE